MMLTFFKRDICEQQLVYTSVHQNPSPGSGTAVVVHLDCCCAVQNTTNILNKDHICFSFFSLPFLCNVNYQCWI